MGINFGTAATIILNSVDDESNATFQCVRYYETDSQGVPLSFPVVNERYTSLPASQFAVLPGSPIVYWFPPQLFDLFADAAHLLNVGSRCERP